MDQLDSDGEPVLRPVSKPRAPRPKAKRPQQSASTVGNSFGPLAVDNDSDAEDEDYESGSALSFPSSSEDESDGNTQITNEEVCRSRYDLHKKLMQHCVLLL